MSIAIYFKTHSIYTINYNWYGLLIPLMCLMVIQLGFESMFSKIAISSFYPILWYVLVLNKGEKKELIGLLK